MRSPTGWLVTAVSRICLDVLGSARARREAYVGEWLPEPVAGEIVGRTPQACRQLASSARRRARETRDRPSAADARVVAELRVAWQAGDIGRLVALLAPEVTAVADGGGVVAATSRPVTGPAAVARLLAGVRRRLPELVLHDATVNGWPGLVARDATGRPLAVVSVVAARGLVERVWVMRNPAKLTTWR